MHEPERGLDWADLHRRVMHWYKSTSSGMAMYRYGRIIDLLLRNGTPAGETPKYVEIILDGEALRLRRLLCGYPTPIRRQP